MGKLCPLKLLAENTGMRRTCTAWPSGFLCESRNPKRNIAGSTIAARRDDARPQSTPAAAEIEARCVRAAARPARPTSAPKARRRRRCAVVAGATASADDLALLVAAARAVETGRRVASSARRRPSHASSAPSRKQLRQHGLETRRAARRAHPRNDPPSSVISPVVKRQPSSHHTKASIL